MSNLRKLKIYKKFQPRERKYIPVPEIRLGGRWLKELGFDIGKEIEIKQHTNKLIITLTNKNKKK
ncbi:SymE family type I addiction module toxin [Abyssalbus ytuae]|uniref:SymE family type I addiction module toxin n=1 Tax=Abyssalbus ytuae TaxID=2926907 RepID=UPI0034E2106F